MTVHKTSMIMVLNDIISSFTYWQIFERFITENNNFQEQQLNRHMHDRSTSYYIIDRPNQSEHF